MTSSRQPMFIAWGPDRTLLYNDAYAPLLGCNHSAALGQPFFDVWPEARDKIVPLFDDVYAGQSVQMDDISLVLARHGRPEEAHFAFSYTPVRDESGEVTGLFCCCMDTTAHVLAERSRTAESERLRQLFEQAPGFMCVLQGPDHVFEFVNAAYSRVFGSRGCVGRTVRETFPDIAGRGFYELLDKVYATGERFVAHGRPIRLRNVPGSPFEEHFVDFIYQPITDQTGRVTGIFCEGHDVTGAYRAQAALRDLNADLERQVIERSHERGRTWQVSPDLLSVLTLAGVFESTNPAWQAALGWSGPEFGGRPFSDFVHPENEAADGSGGLKVLQSDIRIELLVTDVGLPGGMNGRQVADAGRAIRPALKVLLITGYAETAAVGHGHLDHGMRVLTKPFAMEALTSRIRKR